MSVFSNGLDIKNFQDSDIEKDIKSISVLCDMRKFAVEKIWLFKFILFLEQI